MTQSSNVVLWVQSSDYGESYGGGKPYIVNLRELSRVTTDVAAQNDKIYGAKQTFSLWLKRRPELQSTASLEVTGRRVDSKCTGVVVLRKSSAGLYYSLSDR